MSGFCRSRPTDGNDREHFLPYTLSLTGSAPDAADAGQLGEAARDTRASAATAVGFRRSRRLFRVAAVASISSWPLAFVLAARCSVAAAGCVGGVGGQRACRHLIDDIISKAPQKPFYSLSTARALVLSLFGVSDAYRPDGYRTDSNGTSISHLRQ